MFLHKFALNIRIKLNQTIAEYKILEPLGSNSISSTYKASDHNDKTVVIKVFRSNLSKYTETFLAIDQRIALLSNAKHPGLINVISTGMDNGRWWVVTEYCEYQTLEMLLKNPQNLNQITIILKNLVDTISYFNTMEIYHANITPSNIFVNIQTHEVKISNLFITQELRGLNNNTYKSTSRPETPYIAPESLNNGFAGLSANIYSIGIIAYRMISGVLPYTSLDHLASYTEKTSHAPKQLSKINKDLPKEVDFIFNKVLSPHINMRYKTINEFFYDFDSISFKTNYDKLRPMNENSPTQNTIPGLENELIADTTQARTNIRCRLCGCENSPQAEMCKDCRSILTRTGTTNNENIASSEERTLTKRKLDKIRRTLLGGISICFLTFSITQFLDITFPLPPATSNISSISESGEWAMIHGSHSGLSQVNGENLSITGNVKWAFKTGEKIVSTPVLKGDIVYVNTQNKGIVALNKDTGSIIWERPTEIPVDSSPTVTKDLIFVGLRNNRVIALDRYNGNEKWQFTMPDNPNALPLTGSPLVKDGVLYIGSGDNKLYALDASTGEKKWDYLTRHWITNTPAISDNLLVISSMDGRVTVHDTNTGKRRFSFRGLGPHIIGSPSISGESIYVTYRNGIVISVNLKEEEVLFFSRYYRLRLQLWLWGMMDHPGLPKGVNWVRPMGGTILSTAASDNEKVYISTNEGLLHALNGKTGEREWVYDVRPLQLSSPTIIENTILLTDASGTLHAVNKQNGEPLWNKQVSNNLSSIPVLADGVLYLASRDGTLYAIE